GHVADDHRHPPIVKDEVIIEITAHRLRGLVEPRKLPARYFGRLLRQQGLLDKPRHLKLLVKPLALQRLGLLLQDELRDAEGRRGLARKRAQHAAILGRVPQLAQARAERQPADQVALRSEETRLNSSHVKISHAVFCWIIKSLSRYLDRKS